MKTYATTKDVMILKKSLKEKYKEIFKVHKEDDLSPVEKAVYKDYLFSKAFDVFEGDTYKKYEGEDKKELDAVLTKLNGQRLNNNNMIEALDALKTAYKTHMGHIAPKWYQLSKRFAYWMEERALKSFENALMKKGVSDIAILDTKINAQDEFINKELGIVETKPEFALNLTLQNNPLLMPIVDEHDMVNNDFLMYKNSSSLNIKISRDNIAFEDTNLLSEKNLAY